AGSFLISLSWSKDLITEPAFSSLLFLSRVQVNFIASFFTTENKSKAPKTSYKGESFSSVITTPQRIGCDMAHFNYIS
ncbi:hypothetical protein DET48_12188, partial [Vibrio diazotrophicus]